MYKSSKTKILGTGVILAMFLSPFVVAENTLYGRANLSLQGSDRNGASLLEVVSNNSRLGLRGSEVLESGYEFFYQYEFEVALDDGINSNGETFRQRNIFVGLRSTWGSVQAGHFDTPLRAVQNRVDLFDDLAGDIRSLFTVNENRVSNMGSYTSPEGVLMGSIAIISSESEEVNNGYSASLVYTGIRNVYVGFAMDIDVENEGASAFRGVAQYKWGANVLLGALLENNEDVFGETSSGTLVSAQYTAAPWVWKGQVGVSGIVEEGGQIGSFGVDYIFSETAKIFAYLSIEESDFGTDNSFVGSGIEFRF